MVEREGRLVAKVFSPSGVDVGGRLVAPRRALAVLNGRCRRRERAKRGMWRGTFVKPWEWPESRTLKTAGAKRSIPIHPLIRPAFLAYVSGIEHERLFPELSLDSRGRFSDNFQKWFSRYLDRIGARAPRTSYHSFRHCFRDRLREAQVSDELVDALMGWTRRTMRETYGSGPTVHALAEAVSRVEYPGLDLSHLYVR